MEQNVQVVAKKLWHIVRVAFFMARKSMTKRKFLLELKYLTMKCPKLIRKSYAGKINNHYHHHHHHHHHHHPSDAYEFSCSNTPSHPNNFLPFQNKKAHKKKDHYPHSPISKEVAESDMHAVNKVLEMMLTSENCQIDNVEGSPFPYFYSPVLTGIGVGRNPIVRVTDSPYLLHDGEVGNYKVDEAAEAFIQRFYDQLNQQRLLN